MPVHKQGFLLYELLLVFGLVSIIAGFAFSRMRFLTRGYARSEIQALHQMCLYAQRRAISSGRPCAVILDVAKHSYACNERVCVLPKDVRFGVLPQVKGPPSAPQHILTHACSFKDNTITCSPDGIINVGTVYMTDGSSECLYALTSGVAPYSFLRTYRYAGTWQRLK